MNYKSLFYKIIKHNNIFKIKILNFDINFLYKNFHLKILKKIIYLKSL